MFKSRIRVLLTGLAGLILSGCAAVGTEPNPADPWEGSNRNVFAVNDAIDKAVIRPVTEVYAFFIPSPVRTCVNNVFLNIVEPWSGFNSLLQDRGHDAVNTLGRFLLNSTMGVGGCIDLASLKGQPRIQNDFGITLGVWGFDSGPYLVLPILGSSTVRDGLGTIADLYGAQLATVGQINDVPVRNTLWGLDFLSRRDALLPVSKTIDRTALDPYSFIRDAYLQRRSATIRERLRIAEELPNYEDDAAAQVDEKALGIAQEKTE